MSGEGFLSRWSRRKREAAQTQPGVPAPPPSAPEAAVPAEAFDPASLPPVESLTGASDFAAFLRAEVPAALRQAALRRAWTLDPAIRDFIGPADYAWDYNAPDGVPGFATSLAGDVAKLVEQAIGAVERLVEEPAPEAEKPESPPEPAEAPAPAVLVEAAPEPLPEASETPLPRRRHGSAIPI